MAQTPADIKALLTSRGMHPRHRFGQNFLIDPRKVQQIIEAASIVPGCLVLEVGPGTGVLTEALLEAGAHVVAVEIDRDLCAILRERLGEHARFTLIEADVMAGKRALNADVVRAVQHPTSDIAHPPFTLIANLPYNIASPLLATLAVDHPAMTGAIAMVQREVADRITAPGGHSGGGGKDFGPLTVMIQAMCTAERIMTLSPGCFWPQPKIDSAVIRLARRSEPLTDAPRELEAMTQRLFQKRRKQIGAILGRDVVLPAGVEPTMRPEQLTVEQIAALIDEPQSHRDTE